MPRFGEVDLRQIENMRRVMEANTAIFNQENALRLQRERELATREYEAKNRMQVNDILTRTAEAIAAGVEEIPKPQPTLPGQTPSPVKPEQQKPVRRPLTSEEKNRLIDQAALRAYSIPGGEGAAEHLYRYKDANPRKTFEQEVFLEQLKQKGRERVTNLILGERSSRQPSKGSIWIFDKDGKTPIGVKSNADTKDIERAREDYEDRVAQWTSVLEDAKMLEGFGIESAESVKTAEAKLGEATAYLNALKNVDAKVKPDSSSSGGTKKIKVTLQEIRQGYKERGKDTSGLSDEALRAFLLTQKDFMDKYEISDK